MGVVQSISAAEVSQLINTTGVDLILSDLLSKKNGGRPECPVCPVIPVYLLQLLADFF